MGGQVQLLRGWRPVTEADRRQAVDDRHRSTASPATCSRPPDRASRRSCPTSATASPSPFRRRASRLTGVHHDPDPDHRPRARRDPARRHRAVDAARPRGHVRQAARRAADLVPRGAGAAARSRRLPAGPRLLGAHPLRRRDAGVSRDPDTFHSAPSINIGDIPAEIAEWLGSMINMDAPEAHEAAADREPRVHAPPGRAHRGHRARAGAGDRRARRRRCGECDFVTEIAAALPLQIICDMMGIPRADTKRIFELTNIDPRRRRPRVRADDGRAHGRGHGAVPVRPRARARTDSTNPRDDITTTLMQAEVEDEDGEHRLTPGELGSFFLLLVVAGNETTRNAISHGMLALTEHPDQRAHLDRRLRARSRRPRSRRSCAGRRR